MRWCPISCLLQLLLPVRDRNERGLWCLLSTSTASHHKPATVYDGQTETPLRRRALPDGRKHRYCRDRKASHHLSGKDTRDERHFQVREGPERPKVGRSGGWTERQAAHSGCLALLSTLLFIGQYPVFGPSGFTAVYVENARNHRKSSTKKKKRLSSNG